MKKKRGHSNARKDARARKLDRAGGRPPVPVPLHQDDKRFALVAHYVLEEAYGHIPREVVASIVAFLDDRSKLAHAEYPMANEISATYPSASEHALTNPLANRAGYISKFTREAFDEQIAITPKEAQGWYTHSIVYLRIFLDGLRSDSDGAGFKIASESLSRLGWGEKLLKLLELVAGQLRK
jgi:hypothetical protein